MLVERFSVALPFNSRFPVTKSVDSWERTRAEDGPMTKLPPIVRFPEGMVRSEVEMKVKYRCLLGSFRVI